MLISKPITTDLNLEVIKNGQTHFLLIELNNPDRSNAITIQMCKEIKESLEWAMGESSIFGVLLSGAGKNFCSGGDVESMANRSGMFAGDENELMMNYQRYIQQIPLAIEKFNKPIIALVNGAAIGAGFDLSLMCDIRICSDDARFGETFARLGLIPGDGGTYFLSRVVGYAKALELTLTCDVIDSELALKLGIVRNVFDRAGLRSEGIKLLEKMSKNSLTALIEAKIALKKLYSKEIQDHLIYLSKIQGKLQTDPDHQIRLQMMLKK